MAWQQVMPVRNNPAGKEVSGEWVAPANTFKVAARLIMDEVDRIDPTLQITIEVVDVATNKLVIGSVWVGGYLTKAGIYGPPNMEYRRFDGLGNPRDLAGRTFFFAVTANRAVRYGAEIDLEV